MTMQSLNILSNFLQFYSDRLTEQLKKKVVLEKQFALWSQALKSFNHSNFCVLLMQWRTLYKHTTLIGCKCYYM